MSHAWQPASPGGTDALVTLSRHFSLCQLEVKPLKNKKIQQKKKKPPLQFLFSVYIDQSPPVRRDSLNRQLVSAVLRIYKYTYLKRELELDSDARFCVYPPGHSELHSA